MRTVFSGLSPPVIADVADETERILQVAVIAGLASDGRHRLTATPRPRRGEIRPLTNWP